MTAQATENKYFDLHTTGIGYFNRIREVSPKGRKAQPFMAVTVAALRGSTDDVEYTYIDCNVVGAEAEKLVRRCEQAVNAGKRVLVAFRIGDVWADAFTYSSGEKQGKPGASLKGRLLYIGFIKVDGVLVYEAKPREAHDASPADDQSGQSTGEQPAAQSQAEASPADAAPAASAPAEQAPEKAPAPKGKRKSAAKPAAEQPEPANVPTDAASF